MSPPPTPATSTVELRTPGGKTEIVFEPEVLLVTSEGAAFDLIVADSNTVGLLDRSSGGKVMVVPPGEACKQPEVLIQLLAAFAELRLTRDSVVAAFGGGAVTDLVALAASLYMRGIRVVLVPTSLLAMVDAAIGGKTGIDFCGIKNLVGSFYPAAEVRIRSGLITSLSQREYRSGLGEVIKAALLADTHLLELLERSRDAVLARNGAVVAQMVRMAVQTKIDVVARDFRETGERAYLNLGHTFAHALEAVAGLGTWTHGEAVAWGIARAMHLGSEVVSTDHRWVRRVLRLLTAYGYAVDPASADPAAIVAAMQLDKKRRKGGLRFVLQTGQSTTEVHTAPEAAVLRALEARSGSQGERMV